MNKRDLLLSLIDSTPIQLPYTPAAFFLHFDEAHHTGQAAVDKHLAFFRHTGMDFVKVQYEQPLPPNPPVTRPADWARAPVFPPEHFEAPAAVARGLVQAAGREALVIMTLYSPFMWARRFAGAEAMAAHLTEDPEAVLAGLEIMVENVLNLVGACKQAGVDGFYASSQGGEAGRFPTGSRFFDTYIKPADLAIWDAISDCAFNILHVCDYELPYDDLSPFRDYPGHVVNCSLKIGSDQWTPRQAAEFFGRPFMGGLERLGTLAIGSPEDARRAAQAALAQAPERFVLGADCTVPSDTSWDNLRAAIEAAHQHQP
jgi:uroporphyrinogen decarboxylase